MIAQMPGLRVVATGTNVMEALQSFDGARLDLAVISVEASCPDEPESIRTFKRLNPSAAIVLLVNTPESLRGVLRTQALGYVLTSDGKREFESALSYAAEGIPYYSEKIADELTRMSSLHRDLPRGEPETEGTPLTKREWEIISLVASGYSSWEIGDQLCISPMTVNTHRRNLMRKLGVKNALGLVKYALTNTAHERAEFSQLY
jgi:DNA-binding NarL/FixJ family response regulator